MVDGEVVCTGLESKNKINAVVCQSYRLRYHTDVKYAMKYHAKEDKNI